jgi:translation elongation factor EF-Tu-like GTPase
LQFSKDDVISNLDVVGINLGHDHTTIDSSISNLR